MIVCPAQEDPNISYLVEGGICSVSGQSTRVFRNRLSVYGGELCWDARRFWHFMNFSALPPAGERVERVEWNPGQGSPPTKQIIWLRTDDADEAEPADAAEAAAEETPEA